MEFLRSNTAVIVPVGPFYDKTDGVTIETGLTITNERITLIAGTDEGSAPTLILDNIAGATAATANDLNYITNGDNGMMQLELAAADVNRVGRMKLSITDAANHVPVFHDYFVLPQAIFDWLTGVIVPLPANVTQLLGTAWLTPGVAGTPDVNAKQLGAAPVTATTSVTIPAASTLATTTGAVGSVTGAVGSVTGAVGSVTGAVGSVTGAVGSVTTVTSIVNGVLDADMTSHQTLGTLGQAIGDPVADTNTIYKAVVTDATGATVGVDVVAVKADTAAILVDTADMQPKLGTPAGASISADILVIDNFVDGLETTIGAAGAGLTAVPWNATWDAEVQSEVDDALVVQRLDELMNADSDIDGVAPPTVGSVIHELLTKTAGSFTYDQTTDSLEAIRDKETDIETDTAEIGAAGAGLTNINLPNQTMDIVGNVTGNLSGSVGSVTGAVGSVTGAVGSVTAGVSVAVGGIGSTAFAAGAVDAAALATDAVTEIWAKTLAELAQAAPSATPTVLNAIAMLYMIARNAVTVSATSKTFSNDAGTVVFKKALSDDGTTYTEAETATGP